MLRTAGLISAITFCFAGCTSSELDPLDLQLQVPSLVDFGDRPVGAEITLDVALENPFEQTISIERAELDAGGSSDTFAFRVVSTPILIAPKSIGKLELAFKAFAPMNLAVVSVLSVTTGAGTSKITVRGRGIAALSVSATMLDFGTVYTGASREETLTITNLLDDPLALRSNGAPRPSQQGGRFELVDPIDRILSPRGYVRARLRYTPALQAPAEDRPDQSAWSFSHCDVAAHCSTSIELLGRHAENTAGHLVLDPPELDFGAVTVGTAARQAFTARNIGLTAVVIGSIIDDVRGTGAFRVLDAGGTLEPGEIASFDVEFRPGAPGIRESEVRLETNDPVTPTYQLPIRGEGIEPPTCSWTLLPRSLDFGSVEVLRTQTAAMIFQNVGAATCALSNLSIGGSQAAYFHIVSTTPARLAAGETAVIEVSYAPNNTGVDQATLQLELNDPAAPITELSLRGRGVTNSLGIYPDRLDFGAVTGGCRSDTRVIHLRNPTGAAKTIDQISLSQPTSTNFDLTVPALPFVLEPFESIEVHVEYRPSIEAVDAGSIVISESGVTDPYTVWLLGREGERAVERFVHAGTRVVDVVMAIDISSSMNEENILINDNLPLFTQAADASGADYQIGRANIGFSDAMITVLGELRAPTLLASSSGLFRHGSSVAIIYLTNQDDTSPGPMEMYLEELLRIHGARNKNDTTVHVVAGDLLVGCFGAGGPADPSPRFAELADRGRGTFASICGDWSSIYAELAGAIFGPRERYLLENVPVVSSLEVRLDGVLTPAVDASGQAQWSYDLASNEIVFSPFFAPDSGVEVEISYFTNCN